MMTFNIKVDLDNPSTSKFEVPSNMPYAVRLELYKGGLAHAAWDGDYGVGNVIPTSQSYEAKFSENKWINSADAWKDGFFAESEGAVTVDSEFPYIVTLNCAARAEGSDGVKLLINPTDTNWDAIPSTSTIKEGDADPRIASRIEIVFNYVSKEGCKPAEEEEVVVPTKVSELENDVPYTPKSYVDNLNEERQQESADIEQSMAEKRGLGDLEYTFPIDPEDPYRGIIDFKIELDGEDVFLDQRTSQEVDTDTEYKWASEDEEYEDVYVTKLDEDADYVIHAYESEIRMSKSYVDMGSPITYTKEGEQKTGFIWAEYLKTNIALIDEIPTKVSELTNDSGFQNSTQVASAINTAIAAQDTITMSGTYEDDTEFEFTIVGKTAE